jgi:pSer/pThr/pTyr-binding forkhead associated (FHA) protein
MAKAYLYHRNTGHIKPLNVDTTFGRATGDWTFADDDVVSTRHGQFVIKGDQVYLVDLGSTNGTFINRKDLEPQRPVLLHELDEIQFGGQEFVFTMQANLGASEIEEKISNKKRDSLLGQVKKTREAKVAELEDHAKKLLAQKDKWEQLIQQKTDSLNNAKQAYMEKNKLIKENETRAQSLEQNMAGEQKKIEDAKIPHYQKQTALLDKLKLLEMANAEPDKQTQLRQELKVVEQNLSKLEGQKLNLPNLLKEYKSQVVKLTADAAGLKLALEETQNDYNKTISQAEAKNLEIHDQITQLHDQLEKARTALKSV